jgi:hypothetical protein
MRSSVTPAILLAVMVACAARADTTLDVEIGWDHHFRPGRWAPVFVTISDSAPRALLMEVFAPHSGGYGMVIRQQVSASAKETTYVVYLPMPWQASEILVVLRDATTLRWLVQWPEFDQRSGVMMRDFRQGPMIGTSGRAPALRALEAALPQRQFGIAHIPPERLPSDAIGYDTFEALILSEPDVPRMSVERQEAIADWVSAGGRLIVWPGEDPWPLASPLVAAMPCTVGENFLLQVEPTHAQSAGVTSDPLHLKARRLAPRPGAVPLMLLNTPDATGWCANVGFGEVIVLPFDPGSLQFKDHASIQAFYKPLLRSAGSETLWDGSTNYYSLEHTSQRRRVTAFSRAADMLGNVPGVGRFGFGYVAGVLIAMMVIVGPLDWFVLKFLGRQPWTWFTTTGWIALITLGAIFMGHVFRSGDLYFRTLRIIDQADGASVAMTDLVCVYSPRTRTYEIQTDQQSWWQPGSAEYYSSGNMRTDVPFAQSARGNHPQPMTINVWNLRFLLGESISRGPPVIEASLRLEAHAESGARVVGTITNKSASPLRNLCIRSKPGEGPAQDGVPPWHFTRLEGMKIDPGATIAVSAVLGANWGSPDNTEIWGYVPDLALDRSQAIDRQLSARDDILCIYAEAENPVPAVGLSDPTARRQNWQLIRALVPVQGAKP